MKVFKVLRYSGNYKSSALSEKPESSEEENLESWSITFDPHERSHCLSLSHLSQIADLSSRLLERPHAFVQETSWERTYWKERRWASLLQRLLYFPIRREEVASGAPQSLKARTFCSGLVAEWEEPFLLLLQGCAWGQGLIIAIRRVPGSRQGARTPSIQNREEEAENMGCGNGGGKLTSTERSRHCTSAAWTVLTTTWGTCPGDCPNYWRQERQESHNLAKRRRPEETLWQLWPYI